MSKFSDLYNKHNADKASKDSSATAFAAAKSALDSATAAETTSRHELAGAVYAAQGHQTYELLPSGVLKVYTSVDPTAYDETFPAGPDAEVPAAPPAPTTPAAPVTTPVTTPTAQ